MTTTLRRELGVWQAVGLSLALMAPSMAANINPQGTAGAAALDSLGIWTNQRGTDDAGVPPFAGRRRCSGIWTRSTWRSGSAT